MITKKRFSINAIARSKNLTLAFKQTTPRSHDFTSKLNADESAWWCFVVLFNNLGETTFFFKDM